MDQNELLRRLAAQAGGDAALERLSGALGTADGRRAVEQLSAQHADELEQAAKAAQRGDMRSACLLYTSRFRPERPVPPD